MTGYIGGQFVLLYPSALESCVGFGSSNYTTTVRFILSIYHLSGQLRLIRHFVQTLLESYCEHSMYMNLYHIVCNVIEDRTPLL